MNTKKKQLPFFTRMLHPSVETAAAVVATVISVAALVISVLSYRLSSEQVLEQQKLVVAEKLTEIKLLVLEEKEALDEGMRNLRDLDPPPMDLDELEKLYRSMRSFYDKLEIHYLSLILSGDMVAAERLRGTLLLSSKNVTGGLKLSEKLISNPGMWRIGNCVNEEITRLREKPTKSSDEYQLIVDRCFKQEEMEKN